MNPYGRPIIPGRRYNILERKKKTGIFYEARGHEPRKWNQYIFSSSDRSEVEAEAEKWKETGIFPPRTGRTVSRPYDPNAPRKYMIFTREEQRGDQTVTLHVGWGETRDAQGKMMRNIHLIQHLDREKVKAVCEQWVKDGIKPPSLPRGTKHQNPDYPDTKVMNGASGVWYKAKAFHPRSKKVTHFGHFDTIQEAQEAADKFLQTGTYPLRKTGQAPGYRFRTNPDTGKREITRDPEEMAKIDEEQRKRTRAREAKKRIKNGHKPRASREATRPAPAFLGLNSVNTADGRVEALKKADQRAKKPKGLNRDQIDELKERIHHLRLAYYRVKNNGIRPIEVSTAELFTIRADQAKFILEHIPEKSEFPISIIQKANFVRLVSEPHRSHRCHYIQNPAFDAHEKNCTSFPG